MHQQEITNENLFTVATLSILFLDFESLLHFRTLNKTFKTLVSEYVPLLCARDGIYPVKHFFHWALLHARVQKTRYSHWFKREEVEYIIEEAPVLEILAALEEGNFDLATLLLTPELLNQEIFYSVLTAFGDDDMHLDWFKQLLQSTVQRNRSQTREDNDDPGDWSVAQWYPNPYEQAMITALNIGNPKIIAKLWTEEMMECFSKNEVLKLACRSDKNNITLLYLLDTLYPNLQRLVNNLDCQVPETWIVEKVKNNRSIGVSTWICTLLQLSLESDNLHLCNLILTHSTCKLDPGYYIKHCGSAEALQWMCEHAIISKPGRAVEMLKQALKLNCSKVMLEDILLTCGIETIGACTLLRAQTLAQHQCLLPLVGEEWYKEDLCRGEIMLLSYYDKEKFHPKKMLSNKNIKFELLEWILECYAQDIDWDELVHSYLHGFDVNQKTIAFILNKDAEVNGFALPARWK